MQEGDLVVKQGDYDCGRIAVVLRVFTNPLGHKFVQVFNEGKIKTWYYDKVYLICNNDT